MQSLAESNYMKKIKGLADTEQNSKIRVFVQFLKFGLVGGMNTLLSLAVTYGGMALFHFIFHINTTWSLNICTTRGYIAGVCNSYFWNSRYVFTKRQEKSKKNAFLKVCLCYGGTYLLSVFLMDIMVVYMHVPSVIAPIPRLIITIPLNFVANKLWAFKDR